MTAESHRVAQDNNGSSEFFSVQELLALSIDGVPRTAAGIYQRIKKGGWESRVRGGRGGRLGGVREYKIPDNLRREIARRQPSDPPQTDVALASLRELVDAIDACTSAFDRLAAQFNALAY